MKTIRSDEVNNHLLRQEKAREYLLKKRAENIVKFIFVLAICLFIGVIVYVVESAKNL